MINEKEALRNWKNLGAQIANLSTLKYNESDAEKIARVKKVRANFAAFVAYYFPHYCQDRTTGKPIKPAKFHIQAAKEILNNNNIKAVYQWARGHAKSTYMDIIIPMWLMCQEKRTINVMVLVGKSEDNACTLLGDLQAELQYNKRYIADFGAKYNAGDWQEGQFVTFDGVACFALGRGQSPRGLRYRNSRPDYVVIDDLDDEEMCRNEKRVHDCTNWVKEALFGVFGASGGRFIMVGNLIAKKSVLSEIINTKGVVTSKINIRNNKNEPSWAEFWTNERITEVEQFMGYRSFQKEYMNNPLTEGAVFQQKDIRFGKMLPLCQYTSIVCYTDPSFKSSSKADYKATALVGITKHGDYHILRMYAAQTTVVEMVRWHYEIMELIGGVVPVRYMIEANFMQDLLLDEFKKEGDARGCHVPIIGDKRQKGDKFARIEAMQPLFERGLVILNEKEKDKFGFPVLVDQLLAFEKGSHAHDDAPDAVESAVWQLNRTQRTHAFKPQIGHRPKPQNYY